MGQLVSEVYQFSCHNLVQRDLECLSLQQCQDYTLACYIGDIVLIGPSEQEIVTPLDLLGRHLGVRGWEINLIRVHGPPTSGKILGVEWCGVHQDIPSKVRHTLLHVALLQPKRCTMPSAPLWVLKVG